MNWVKRGRIYSPDSAIQWRARYGMMPTPLHIPEAGIIRIFFGVTTADNFGTTTYIDVDDRNPSNVINTSPETPSLDLGIPGTFDDAGAVPSSVIFKDGQFYLYYVGFQRCQGVPYMLFPGLSISKDARTFARWSHAPIIDRTKEYALSFAAPFVLEDDGIYKMWLWIGQSWTAVNGKLYLNATIGYAESHDAISWKIIHSECIVPEAPAQFSVGRPWVMKVDGKYKMFYSIRYIEKLYRLGYAESDDGIHWTRHDAAMNLDVSAEGWDSEMVCYPACITIDKKTYLFYNGNNNGETGFGWAELSADNQ